MGALMPKGLASLLERIVTCYAPKKIILFGSQARGDVDEESDLDLVIGAASAKSFVGRLRESVDLLPEAKLDVLIYTPEEWEEMVAAANPFIEQLLAGGRCSTKRIRL